MRIAVVGAGVSGLVAARLLSAAHEVTLFESEDRLGGHAHTHEIMPPGHKEQPITIDTGFMVFNKRTYPNFCRLLQELGVASQDSDMSFSVLCDRTRLEYQGSSINGLFAQRSNLLKPKFYRLLSDVFRFNRDALAYVEAQKRSEQPDTTTLQEFLEQYRYSTPFIESYLKPMTAAIWSAKPSEVEAFPAKFLLGFYANHGLLQIRDRPQWLTVRGGSREYVQAISNNMHQSLRLSTPVNTIRRVDNKVELTHSDSVTESYDRVVLACHADQSLKMLVDADAKERSLLESFPYQANEAIVHSDISVMPQRKRAWASWNYRTRVSSNEEQVSESPVEVTYYLNRLQKLNSSQPIFVTLNPSQPIPEEHILKRIDYSHPCYTQASVAAQTELPLRQGERQVYFCGAYAGYGFHEDGVRSALAVAKCFDLSLDDLFRGQFSSVSARGDEQIGVVR